MSQDTSPAPLSVTVLGGTGYTGAAIARVAAARGHQVTTISRSTPTDITTGLAHVSGSALDEETLLRAVTGADVVISALSPRGELFDHLAGVDLRLAELVATHGVRLGVIGGFTSLRPAPGAPRMAEGDDMPAEIAAEGKQMLGVLQALETSTADWFYASPSMGYGPRVSSPTRGTWRVGGDVADLDPDRAALSDADFAGAIVAEIEAPTHHRTVFSVTGQASS